VFFHIEMSLTEHGADRACAPAQYRWHVYKSIREAIDKNEGGLEKFSQGYKYYGLNRGEHEGKKGTWYREWAPGARVRDPPRLLPARRLRVEVRVQGRGFYMLSRPRQLSLF